MRELTLEEIAQVSGGNVLWAMEAIGVIDFAMDFVKGFKEGYATAEPRVL
ncbi:MAG TPA: class IIb bacteriocin, lactobin A/cerein 7B family [Stenotrophomonas sp.]|jgi:lactobin A/cerein 7B family class IIb bacteriocin